MKMKNKILLLFVQIYQKRKEVPYKEMSVTMTDKGKNLLIWKRHVTNTKKDAYISNEKQLQNKFSSFIP